MTSRKPRKSTEKEQFTEDVEQIEEIPAPLPSGVVFLGEEDKRLLKQFDKHIVKKLGISSNRSFKV